ncbi:hypothetical protein SDC9_116869 [bioreactor metagenome]|uniref:Uncharacterized protein n=1 Tax=bioreactor metagenome TaxID=1076179 RepID=A0A645BZ25_9ZZZZ
MFRRSSARATRCSNSVSSLSSGSAARLETLLARSPSRALAACNCSWAIACACFCSARPSCTRTLNTLPPSCCAFENAPSPASQICSADSLANCGSCCSCGGMALPVVGLRLMGNDPFLRMIGLVFKPAMRAVGCQPVSSLTSL